MIISKGFTPDERPIIAALYWEAFGKKLGKVLGPDDLALNFIQSVLCPDHGICARENGEILGVVGFKTIDGALVGGGWLEMRAGFGIWGAAWRSVVLSLLERDTDNERFLMDGIFVTENARGRGVGSMLLDAVADEARERGYAKLRLDVIDNNPKARALYERRGFVAKQTQHLGPLKHLFGFASATTMEKKLV